MLHEAITKKDLSALQAALAARADPNEVNAHGFSALEVAAAAGTDEMVLALLEAGADPSRAKSSVLGAAVRRRLPSMVALLLARKLDPNHTNSPELIPMQEALRWSAQVALQLLAHGATLTDELGLMAPIASGTPAERKALMDLAIERTSIPTRLLERLTVYCPKASELGEWVQRLVAKGGSVNSRDVQPPLFEAARATEVDAVKVLMAVGASVDAVLPHDWLEYDDEGERVIASAGTTVRDFFIRMYREEAADLARYPRPARSKRLDETAGALGIEVTAVPAPTAPFGTWLEVRREFVTADPEDGTRTETVKAGGSLEWAKDGAFSVTGRLGCGLTGKGKLKLDRSKVTVKGLEGTFQPGKLRLSSEPDDEHGLVVTSVFELKEPAASKVKPKVPAKKPAAPKKTATKKTGKKR